METKNRRSGANRREQRVDVSIDKRKGKERRDVVNDSDRIIEFMKKIPIFKGLNSEQYAKILNICSKKKISQDHFLCQEGEESNELYILIKGQLKVMFHGTSLAHISPLGLVGEIGVFTDTQRSATVIATNESTVISISKYELLKLFKNECVLSNRIFLNVINDLAKKLQEDNEVIEELRNKKRTRIL